MTITFITGANRSLGHETARRLIDAGHTVLIGARDVQRGREAADALGARFVQIDVTDDASVEAAVADVAAHEGAVDVLINNAGINAPHVPAEEQTADDAAAVFGVNVVGLIRVTRAFLPLLRRSTNPVIVNVSSGMGSFAATRRSTRPGPDRASRRTSPCRC
jgi:NAD(P)-dependent dehydrogenase (short-subunit alcohol dehydrogenase family)